MIPAPVLHWPLDSVTSDATVLDVTPNHLSGTAQGAPTATADPRFGSCLRLDGTTDYLVAKGTPSLRVTAYTLSAWFKADRLVSGSGLFAHSANIDVRLGTGGSISHTYGIARGATDGHSAPKGTVTAGSWHHVAVSHDGTTARIHVDGVVVSQHASTGPRISVQADLSTGYGPSCFPGLIAHFRVYDQAQSPADIKQDMADDEAALESFVRTHPVGFAFVNADTQPVLYIDEAPALQTMTLRLTNTSRSTVVTTPVTTLSSTDFHFALRLRKGTLASGLHATCPTSGWAMAAEPDGTALYFQWTSPQPLAPGQSVEVQVAGLNADGAAGTHGTRVELEYRRLTYSGQAQELTGDRLQFLDVVNNRGRRDIPIDVRLVGGDRVLSDGGTESTLTLHIANVMRDGPGITLSAVAPVSAFVVSFDVQEDDEDRPWALTTSGNAGQATLTSVDPRWVATPQALGQRMQWAVTPAAATVLGPDEHIELTLKVYALPAAGHAPILVEYQNVPGYADGHFTAMAERTPLLYTASTATIGANSSAARLQIVHTPQDATGNAVIIGTTDQSHLRLGYHQDYSWIQSQGGTPLSINPVGNKVLVNTDGAGDGRLTVRDGSNHLQLRRETADGAGGQTLYLELLQPDTTGTAVTYPSIRFHHSNKFWNRIEGRPDGIHFKFGGIPSDDLIDIHTANVVASGLRVGPIAANDGGFGSATVSAKRQHLQLRREATDGAGGSVLYLELFQPDTTGTAVTYPNILFQHFKKFANRIEGRPDGIYLKHGNLPSDDLESMHAAVVFATGLRIGSTTIYEKELGILQKLAAGQLQFDLYNVKQDEYAYAADYNPYDNDRRYVWTWRPKGRVGQGRWRIDYPD
jgi:hypothetical protein